jgi:hypothetical protein
MKRAIAILLLVIGLIVVVVGVFMALRPVLSVYESAMSDPLSDKGPQDGKEVSRAMIPGLITAAIGLPMVLVGSIMLKIMLFKSLRNKLTSKTPRG